VSGNPHGRPVGAKNLLSADMYRDFAREWHEHGPAIIAAVRQKDPVAFLQIATRLIPKEVVMQLEAQPPRELEEPELDELIERLRDLQKFNAVLKPIVGQLRTLPGGPPLAHAIDAALYELISGRKVQ
jgi:hypothetical protein